MIMALATVAHADEWTTTTLISRMLFDGSLTNNTNTLYFENASGHWDAPSCANARYVIVRVPGIKEILAMGLTAKTTERAVKFLGTCQDANYFSAYYIVVE